MKTSGYLISLLCSLLYFIISIGAFAFYKLRIYSITRVICNFEKCVRLSLLPLHCILLHPTIPTGVWSLPGCTTCISCPLTFSLVWPVRYKEEIRRETMVIYFPVALTISCHLSLAVFL